MRFQLVLRFRCIASVTISAANIQIVVAITTFMLANKANLKANEFTFFPVKEVGLQVPLVVRLEGTNVEKGKEIINTSGLAVIAADNLRDGAEKIVKAVRG